MFERLILFLEGSLKRFILKILQKCMQSYAACKELENMSACTSVGVEPRNVACAPSTATPDAVNHYTIEASPKKDAQVAYITTSDTAVHSVYGFYINYNSVQNYDISLNL